MQTVEETAPGEQVITITPHGAIVGLEHKPGRGIDLKQFGRADKITRASEPIFCPDRQQWRVEFRDAGRWTGFTLTRSLLGMARGEPVPHVGAEDPAFFSAYDDAVQGEIDALNYLRLNDCASLQAAT